MASAVDRPIAAGRRQPRQYIFLHHLVLHAPLTANVVKRHGPVLVLLPTLVSAEIRLPLLFLGPLVVEQPVTHWQWFVCANWRQF
jgi:hypothetical protein